MKRAGAPVDDFSQDAWLEPWRGVFMERGERIAGIVREIGGDLADFAQGH